MFKRVKSLKVRICKLLSVLFPGQQTLFFWEASKGNRSSLPLVSMTSPTAEQEKHVTTVTFLGVDLIVHCVLQSYSSLKGMYIKTPVPS